MIFNYQGNLYTSTEVAPKCKYCVAYNKNVLCDLLWKESKTACEGIRWEKVVVPEADNEPIE